MNIPLDPTNLAGATSREIAVEGNVDWVVEQLSERKRWVAGPQVRVISDPHAHNAAVRQHDLAVKEVVEAETMIERYFANWLMAVCGIAGGITTIVAGGAYANNDPGIGLALLVFAIFPTLYLVLGSALRVRARSLRNQVPQKPEPTVLRVGASAANAHRELVAAIDRALESETSADVMGDLHAARAQADEYLPAIAALPYSDQDTSEPTRDLIRTAAEVMVTSALIVTAAAEREALLGAPRNAPPSLAATRQAVLNEIDAIRDVSAQTGSPDVSTNRALPHTTGA